MSNSARGNGAVGSPSVYYVFFFAWLLAMVASVALFYWHPQKEDTALLEIRQVLLEATVTASIFGIFLQIINQINFQSQLRRSLVSLFSRQPEFLRQFGLDQKKSFVKRTLQSALGEEIYASTVFDEIISPYFDNTEPFRQNYKYTITCSNDIVMELPPSEADKRIYSQFHSDDFIWIEQITSFVQSTVSEPTIPRHLEFIITLDAYSYSDLLVEEGIIFREMLRVGPEIKEELRDLSQTDLESVVKNLFGVRIFSYGEAETAVLNEPPDEPRKKGSTEYLVEWRRYKEQEKGYILITIPNTTKRGEIINDFKVQYKIDIVFRLPHSKQYTNFAVSLPKPTARPDIRFIRKRNCYMKELEVVQFMSQFGTKERAHVVSSDSYGPDHIHFTTERWVFPTSGIMFVWQYGEPDES